MSGGIGFEFPPLRDDEVPDDDGPDSWDPIDLGPYMRGEVVRPSPTVGIMRSDGLQLLYPGKEHSVIGEMESGKTWFAAACVSAEVVLGNHVVYIHFEETDPTDLVERLRALGMFDADIVKFLRFVCPARPASGDAIRALLEPVPSLVIFDGVNEAMSLHRWAIREEDGAAMFRRHLVMPFVRAGAGTLACDHVVKNVEARGRGPLGSIHKGNGITGTLIMLENAEPFGRGTRGRSHVYVTKDRPGFLRQHGRPDDKVPGKTYMGELVVDDSQTRTPDLELRFWAPRDRPEADDDGERVEPRELARRVSKELADMHVLSVVSGLIDAGQTPSLNAVVARSDFGKGKTSESLDRLVLDGALAESRPGLQRVFSRPEPTGPVVHRSVSKDTGTGGTGPGGPEVDHRTTRTTQTGVVAS